MHILKRRLHLNNIEYDQILHKQGRSTDFAPGDWGSNLTSEVRQSRTYQVKKQHGHKTVISKKNMKKCLNSPRFTVGPISKKKNPGKIGS